MSCEVVQGQLSDYLNGALAGAEREGVDAHLAGCGECRRLLGELRLVAGLLQDVPAMPVPSDLGARIHAALDALDDEPAVAPRIPCDEAEDYMSGYLEDDLDEWEAKAFVSHLDGCAPCRRGVDQLRALRTLLRAVPREQLPETLAPRIFAAVEALPGELAAVRPSGMGCEDARDQLFELMEGTLEANEAARVQQHVEVCAACQTVQHQLTAVKTLLRSVPREEMPAGLPGRVAAALEHAAGSVEVPGKVMALPSRKRMSWGSAIAGAAAAVALFLVWNVQTSKLPTIETAAVSTNTDVAVNIGFDVASSVDGVTFQVDLPDGLKFVDDKSHPMLAQSVAWRGSLKQGKTVVPIVVRGTRPGRYEIEAYVSKGAMRKKTTIVLPVTGV